MQKATEISEIKTYRLKQLNAPKLTPAQKADLAKRCNCKVKYIDKALGCFSDDMDFKMYYKLALMIGNVEYAKKYKRDEYISVPFDVVFSLERIEKVRKEKYINESFVFTYKGKRVDNHFIAHEYIHRSLRHKYRFNADAILPNLTNKQIQFIVTDYFFTPAICMFSDNEIVTYMPQMYQKIANKCIWQFFLRTGIITTAKVLFGKYGDGVQFDNFRSVELYGDEDVAIGAYYRSGNWFFRNGYLKCEL